jgi:hypothetical protein
MLNINPEGTMRVRRNQGVLEKGEQKKHDKKRGRGR